MSKTPISDAARAAYEPLRERQQQHFLKVQSERKTRAERHFHRVFGVPQEAVLEGGEIVFTLEGHRLVYTGNLREKRKMVGAGWAYVEKCAGCKQEQGVAFVQTLADFGKLLTEGTPEWECQRCNAAT